MNLGKESGHYWLVNYVSRCGSKKSAAKHIGIPRKTLCRWLVDIERTGKINAHPLRIAIAQERIQNAIGAMSHKQSELGAANALMGIFGYHRAERGDDMQSASFPGELDESSTIRKVDVRTKNRHITTAEIDEHIRNSQMVNDGPRKFRDECKESIDNHMLNSKNVHGSRTADEKARKRKNVLFLYDIHIPNQSEENVALALDYAQSKHEIDTVILGGDFLDCAGVSRFNNNPNECVPLAEEIARGVEFLDSLRRRFPNAHLKLVNGNHEQRMKRFMWEKAVELNGLKGMTIQEQLELQRFNIEWIDNLQRIRDGLGAYKIGKLFVLHGHELGICPSVDCARKYFFRALENIILGHVHRDDKHTEPTLDGTKGAWVVGHLQDEHPEYRAFNKWVSGFAIASFDDDGLFSVKNKTIIEGRVL